MTLLLENWKPVVGFEGMYEISNTGNLRSLKTGSSGKSHRIKRYTINAKGYRVVSMRKDGKNHRKVLHRLVVIAFLGETPIGLCANHKDGNKSNNRVSNFEYITPADNTRHAASLGLTAHGMRHYTRKITDRDALKIRELYKGGLYKQKELAEMFGITRPGISAIIVRRNWKSV